MNANNNPIHILDLMKKADTPLHKELLNTADDINITGVTFSDHAVLVDQLLENMAIEKADLEYVFNAISQATSERVKLSLLSYLCEMKNHTRFKVKPLNTFEEPKHLTDEEYKTRLILSLNATYWGTLFARLNLSRIITDTNYQKLNAHRLTAYVEENPVPFTQENIEQLFVDLNSLEDAEEIKKEFSKFAYDSNLSYTLKKNGSLIIRQVGPYFSNAFPQRMDKFLFSFSYATDPHWFNASENTNKKYAADYKGINLNRNTQVVLLPKEQADQFIKFFGIMAETGQNSKSIIH